MAQEVGAPQQTLGFQFQVSSDQNLGLLAVYKGLYPRSYIGIITSHCISDPYQPTRIFFHGMSSILRVLERYSTLILR